jgi:hypothetical protein
MLPLLLIAIALLWIAGIAWFWHLQSKSRGSVTVTIFDRLLTIMWLPAYLGTLLFLSVAYIWDRYIKTR